MLHLFCSWKKNKHWATKCQCLQTQDLHAERENCEKYFF